MTMIDSTAPVEVPPPTGPPARRHRRWLRWALVGLLVLIAGGGIVYWRATRPPKPVSVNDVVDQYRQQHPTTPAGSLPGGPAPGVYVYATTGFERVSAGNVTHHYPPRTTVTITNTGCGMQVRWDALSGRWWQAQVCATAEGWRLQHYADHHKFLYMSDLHDYTCTQSAASEGDVALVCTTSNGVLTTTLHEVGTEKRMFRGRLVRTTHLRIVQHATGTSISDGTIDAWLLTSGLPAHVELANRGAQRVLGAKVTYTEQATFDLTSTVPRR